MTPVNVRYMVDDVDEAVAFYSRHLDFDLEFQPGPGFAIISRGDLRLMLNTPGGPGGAAQPMPDGRKPEPGGWNRIQLEVQDIEATVNSLRADGVQFRNDVRNGNTFLYNTGPIESLDSANWVRRQSYSVTRYTGTERRVIAHDGLRYVFDGDRLVEKHVGEAVTRYTYDRGGNVVAAARADGTEVAYSYHCWD